MVYKGIDFKREIQTFSYDKILEKEWKPEKLPELRKKVKKEITVMVPTLNRETQEYYNSVFGVLDELCYLREIGAINEIMVVDGSSKNGEPDLDFGKKLVRRVIDKCDKFKAELDLIDPEMPEAKKYPLSFKILNQKDSRYSEIVREDISPHLEEVYQEALMDVDVGKGPGVWLGGPSSTGDIICTIDSDINPPPESELTIKDYVTALIMPILLDENINYVKADYLRISEVKGPGGEIIRVPGGRINRNVYQAWMHGFQNLRFFIGLNHGHATSGEFAGTRLDLINNITPGKGYRLEATINIGAYLANNGDLTKMAQSHLGPWRHIPSGEDAMARMAGQVTEPLVGYAYYVGLKLKPREFMKIYKIEFERQLKRTKEMIDNLPLAGKLDLVYEEGDMEEDRHRIYDIYLPHIEKGVEIAVEAKGICNVLPSWNSVKKNVGDEGYRKLKADMAQASTLYTLELANL